MSLCKVLHPGPNVLPLYCIGEDGHSGDHYAGFRPGNVEVAWPAEPATVCVRLDGLADQIAATMFKRVWPGAESWPGHSWERASEQTRDHYRAHAAALVELLQSLAVQ